MRCCRAGKKKLGTNVELRAWYRLAAHQRRSVRETMAAVDSREFIDWLAFIELETLDYDGWAQNALLCSMVANIVSDKKRYKPEDFMPIAREPKKRRHALDTYRVLKAVKWPSQ